MKKHRMNSWSKSFAEVWRIYKNAYNSDKFVGTFLIGILFFSSLGIWLDLASQIITEQSNQNNTNMPFKIDSFFKSVRFSICYNIYILFWNVYKISSRIFKNNIIHILL